MKKRRKTRMEMVRQIRELRERDPDRFTLSVLANMFNLTPSAISRIVNDERRKEKE